MKRYLLAASILLASAHSWALGDLAELSVYDRDQGRNLHVYEHEGRHYVVGKPGNRYQIILRNRSDQDLLAVTSVDGVNVISGATATWQQSGYVLDPYRQTDIKGWRKSMSHVAQFYFTALSDSYAARTGRPDNVGVIGVALFRSRIEPPPYGEDRELSERDARAADQSAAGAAPPARAEKKLGTGHGQKETSHTPCGLRARVRVAGRSHRHLLRQPSQLTRAGGYSSQARRASTDPFPRRVRAGPAKLIDGERDD